MRFIKGRLLGLILGFLLASVLGAVIGFILGYFWCDKPQAQRYRMEQAASNFNSLSGNANRELIIHTFTLMGYVARGAGAINQEHINKASELMDQMGLRDEAARREAIAAFNEGKSDHFNFDEVMGALRRYAAENEMIGAYILEIQIMIAISDAVLTDEEYRRLALIARALGQSEVSLRNNINLRLAQMQFRRRYQQQSQGSQGYARGGRQDYGNAGQQQSRQQQSRYDERRQDYGRNAGSEQARNGERDKLQDAYSILGVAPTAAPEEIKKAHKRMMLKYHPDRLASQGLPPEMIRLYTEKAQDIQAAFDLIKQTRGFS